MEYIRINNRNNFLISRVPAMHPQSSAYIRYWQRHKKRCIEGFWSIDSTDVEIDIETKLGVQGKGFATMIAATFMIYCVENGITPIWNTTSTISAKLAERCGFDLSDAFETLFLAKGAFDPSMNVDHSIPIALRRFDFGKKEEYSHLNEA